MHLVEKIENGQVLTLEERQELLEYLLQAEPEETYSLIKRIIATTEDTATSPLMQFLSQNDDLYNKVKNFREESK